MSDNERKVSEYIDRLNAERKPAGDDRTASSEELQELYRAVRWVRSLKEPAMPDPGYERKLARSVVAGPWRRNRFAGYGTWRWVSGAAGVAVIAAVLLVHLLTPFGGVTVVQAMEAAFREVKAYHGILEIASTNANGETARQATFDVWADKDGRYYIKELYGANLDVVTVNNGQRKWQVQPEQRQVHLFPAFPDGYRFRFELGHEIREAGNALSTRVVGQETVAGRTASVVEVTPDGGLPYRIWVDEQTKLPLQKETAMIHAIRYTVTYTEIEFAEAIPAPLMAYAVPEAFEEIDTNPERRVADLSEARDAAGFDPVVPGDDPDGAVRERIAVVPDRGAVKMYYSQVSGNRIIVEQRRSDGELSPAPDASIGNAAGATVEIRSPVAEHPEVSSLRWQRDGMEFVVLGDAPVGDLASFAERFMGGPLELPALDAPNAPNAPSVRPAVPVPYDLDVERGDQQNADAGSSPWKLDPIFVAQVFVSLQMSPEGIVGDYPIAEEDLELVESNGKSAVVAVHDDNAPIVAVYLERLIRQDATGVWTVVGYDPAGDAAASRE